MKNYHNYQGVTYFINYKTAYDYAVKHNLPTERIIEYMRGFAIQSNVSGAYYNIETNSF